MRTSNSPNLFQDTIIVFRRATFVGGVFLSALLLCPGLVMAATIFESGMLGPTGVTWQQGIDGEVPGANISSTTFNGVRFQVAQPSITTQIGGHFVSPSGGDFFGAIVALEDENDFPDSGDLSASDVLGHAELTFPVDSQEVFGDLSLFLDPGWYALVFGSGLFGTVNSGAMPLNNLDIEEPSYIAYVSSRWKNLAPADGFAFKNYRFIVSGTIVPELSTFSLAILASLSAVAYKRTFMK